MTAHRDKAAGSSSVTRRFLTIGTVADELATSRDTVEALIHSGDLPAIDVSPHSGGPGKRAMLRVDPADLNKFLDSRRTAPRASRKRTRRRPSNEVIDFV